MASDAEVCWGKVEREEEEVQEDDLEDVACDVILEA